MSLHVSSLGMLKHCGTLNTCSNHWIGWNTDSDCVRAICCAVGSKQQKCHKVYRLYTIFSDKQLRILNLCITDRNWLMTLTQSSMQHSNCPAYLLGYSLLHLELSDHNAHLFTTYDVTSWHIYTNHCACDINMTTNIIQQLQNFIWRRRMVFHWL